MIGVVWYSQQDQQDVFKSSCQSPAQVLFSKPTPGPHPQYLTEHLTH